VLSDGLGGNSQGRAEKLRGEISAVRPNDRAQFGMNRETAEDIDIPQRLKHRAVEFAQEVNLTFGAIAEPKPDRMAGNVTTLNDVWQHGFHSKGSMRGKGRLVRASDRTPDEAYFTQPTLKSAA
jgi:hypothetical protein